MVAPVEGIEGTFQSLLSRQSSKREEDNENPNLLFMQFTPKAHFLSEW